MRDSLDTVALARHAGPGPLATRCRGAKLVGTVRAFLACVLLLATAGGGAGAQDTLRPAQGGYVHSLGLPEIYKPYVGVGIGLARRRDTHLASQLRFGVFRDMGSPVTELVGWAVEGYGGVRDVRADGGVRGLLVSNLLRIGAGVDYDLRDGAGDLLLTFLAPTRRSGIIGGGSDLRLEWLPTRGGSINLSLTVPLRQPHRGSTRPHRDHVVLPDVAPLPLAFGRPDSTLVAALDSVRATAHWINRFVVPSLGAGGDIRHAVAQAAAPLKTRLADHTVDAEIRAYHAALARAFSIAVSDGPLGANGATPVGEAVAERAKAILLDRVLFPYNRLLGQNKKPDTTREFGGHARGLFARWLLLESAVPAVRADAALFVFQQLLDVVEAIRAANRATWGDPRLVWLPLQLALAPEQYDEQQELDTLLSRATEHRITHGNRIWYVHNDRFRLELIKSIGLAREYHVLWVHDFRGVNDSGRPDRLSLLLVTESYLAALRERVGEYDSTGQVPAYMIFLDQHYFERNRSRSLLRLLEDPLGYRLELPASADSLAQSLAAAQERLRRAVQDSRLLATERAQYGEPWLHRLIKVHVNVTNPADPSFRSRLIFPLIGLPDDVMRDHRKVVLYDVSESDPYRGMAMYAGMGIGEHYAGPAWEDRALMLQGPAALALRDKARALLEAQGIRGGEVPHVLRPRPKPADYDRRVQREIAGLDSVGGVASRAVELHNETGYAFKEISVAKATLFNLMSPGGVVKVPDSLWLNEFLASLLVGGALRGVRVLVIAPALASAPAPGWTMVLAHDLLSRLVALRHEFAPEIAAAGGLLRPGLYNPDIGVDDLHQRVHALRQSLTANSFLRDLYAFDPRVYQVLADADSTFGEETGKGTVVRPVGAAAPRLPTDSGVRPKLHFKGFLYVSREGWARLIGGRAMAIGLRSYLEQRSRQVREGPSVGEDPMADAMQQIGQVLITPDLRNVPKEELARWAFFLQVGSPNQDYRSMVMDGEAAVLVSSWTSLYAVPDFVLLTGLVTWIDDQAELNRLLPPPGRTRRGIARWLRLGL
jgi:phosphatidylserine/phosphatidylglycerophosphate/cardiolipin synthase-like enzyme